MHVLSLPMGADTGGVSAAIGRAFEGVEGWDYHAIISTLNQLDYPRDLAWSRSTLGHYWRWADVVHLHHNFKAFEVFRRKGIRVPPRPLVVEFHGTGFRENPKPHLTDMRQRGAVGLVSTLDLWLLAPRELEWLPCPVRMQ